MVSRAHQREPPHLRQTREPSPDFCPVHGNQALKVGLQRHLMKLAGLLP